VSERREGVMLVLGDVRGIDDSYVPLLDDVTKLKGSSICMTLVDNG
jgi:hypothetical protein